MYSYIFNFIVLSTFSSSINCKSRNYGPYAININAIEKCNLSLPVNKIVLNEYELHKRINHNKQNILSGNITIRRDQYMRKGMYIATIIHEGKINPIFNKTTTKPCADIILGPILYQVYRTKMDCLIKIGEYKINDINLDFLAHKVLGNAFYYRQMELLIAFFSNKGICYCSRFIGETVPPKKNSARKP